MAPDADSINGTCSEILSIETPKPSVTPNVLEVVFGSLLIKPWYPSFYPEELVGRRVERLYVCQWCFKYSKELMAFLGHLVSSICSNHYDNSMLIGVESMSLSYRTTPRSQCLHQGQLLSVRNRW